MSTTFEERAGALAIAGGFGLPLTEDQLAFERIEFLDRAGNVIAVSEGDKTLNSRMFFEHTLGEHCLIIASDPCDTPGIACFWYAPDKALADDFFGPELYNDPELGPDHHASVYGGKTAWRLRLYRKEGGLMIALKRIIERGWEVRDTISPESDGALPEAVDIVLEHLDAGALRVAEPDGQGGWIVNQWLKKTVLLSFRLNNNAVMDYGSAGAPSFDKVPLKFSGWDEDRFRAAGIRAVPGSIVRRGAHVGRNVVLMPSFVNIGANIGDGTMIDTWASVGSCAQVGKNCHISAGSGIGGVLEPMQDNPTIIGDNCFIGARSEIVEGVIVGEGCVVAMGVFITATSKIVYRDTGEIITGHIPPYSVVVPGTLPGKLLPDGSPGPSLSCAVIIKTVDEQTRSKTATNDLLRD